jgi:hypothetical protein
MRREVLVFLFVQIAAILLALLALGRPDIESFRPEIISAVPTGWDVAQVVGIVLAGTIVLIAIRLVGLKLRLIVDASVFVATYYLGSIFFGDLAGIALGLAAVIVRATPFLLFTNLTTIVSIESFSILFGLFLRYDLVLLLLAAMSVYDVFAVFYTKHMKFLWFGGWLDSKVERPEWRNTLALFFQGRGVSIIGAGDFALPATLVASVVRAGGALPASIVAVFCAAGFFLLDAIAGKSKKTSVTGIPGIPTISLGALAGVLICRALGLLA